MSGYGKLTIAQVRAIQREWLAGRSAGDIAADYDVSPSAVYYHNRGISRPKLKVGRPHACDYDRAIQLIAKGYLIKDVAARFRVSRQAIWRAMKEQKEAA